MPGVEAGRETSVGDLQVERICRFEGRVLDFDVPFLTFRDLKTDFQKQARQGLRSLDPPGCTQIPGINQVFCPL